MRGTQLENISWFVDLNICNLLCLTVSVWSLRNLSGFHLEIHFRVLKYSQREPSL